MKETIVDTALPTVSDEVRSQSNKHNVALDVNTNTSSFDACLQENTEIEDNVRDLGSPDTKKRRKSNETHCFSKGSDTNCEASNSLAENVFLEEQIDARHNPQETIFCHQKRKETVETRLDDAILEVDPTSNGSNISVGTDTVSKGNTEYAENAGEMDLPHKKRRKNYDARDIIMDVNCSYDPSKISLRKEPVSLVSEIGTEVSPLCLTKIKEEAQSEDPAAEQENGKSSVMKRKISCASKVKEAEIANPYGIPEPGSSLKQEKWEISPSNRTSVSLINEHNSAKSDIVMIEEESVKNYKRKLDIHEKKPKELFNSSASDVEPPEVNESCSSFQILQSNDSVGIASTSASCTDVRPTSESSDDVKNVSVEHCPPKDASTAGFSKEDPDRLTGVIINEIKSLVASTDDLSRDCGVRNSCAEHHSLEDTSTVDHSSELPDKLNVEIINDIKSVVSSSSTDSVEISRSAVKNEVAKASLLIGHSSICSEKEGLEISSSKVETDPSNTSGGDSQYAQKLELPLKDVGSPRRKLLILDVNGILADIVPNVSDGYTPDRWISMKAVFKRPGFDDFLDFCFGRFDVGIWSSRTRKNVDMVVDFLFGKTRSKLLFCWDQSHCTETGYMTIANKKKPLVLKEISKLWDMEEADLPWKKGDYDESNTLLLDDSPYKALCNPPYTAIFPYPYEYKDVNDTTLGPGGRLRVYLERLASAHNVQEFVKENPMDQRPITESNLYWRFYSKIIKERSDRNREKNIAGQRLEEPQVVNK